MLGRFLLCVTDLSAAFCLFQLPLEFRNLGETRRHKIQRNHQLLGFCCDYTNMYCVERQLGDNSYWLAVYDMRSAKDGSLILLDKVEVGYVYSGCCPRVDSSHRVYVPCGWSGVRLFCYQGGRLLPAREPLRCVRGAVAVSTADTVSVCVADAESVCLVNASSDTTIRRLSRPAQVQGWPYHMSVLEQTVLVCYDDNTLVTYHSDSPTTGEVLQTPEMLGKVSSITTDSNSSSYLITDYRTVYVLDNKRLWHRIWECSGALQSCAVVRSQLWLGYEYGDLAVLTSR